MKKILAVLSIAIFITSCQKQKIGYVDNGKVINEMQEKVDLEKKYETKLNAFNAKNNPVVPLVTAHANLLFVKLQNNFSNSFVFFASVNHPESMTDSNSFFSSLSINGSIW